MKGELASFASRRAISVLPTPVGPIMMMFLGMILFRQLGRELLAAHAVSQGDGDGALGGVLADDVLVELADDLFRRQVVELDLSLFGGRWKINGHVGLLDEIVMVPDSARTRQGEACKNLAQLRSSCMDRRANTLLLLATALLLAGCGAARPEWKAQDLLCNSSKLQVSLCMKARAPGDAGRGKSPSPARAS